MLDPQAVLSRASQGRARRPGGSSPRKEAGVRGFLRGTSAAGQYQTIQAFIEAYGAHKALRDGGLRPD